MQAKPFGLVHRGIGVVQQFVRRLSIDRTNGNPDARTHQQTQLPDLARRRYRVIYLARKLT